MWIEVFRTGYHTDSNGNSTEYSTSDIAQIAQNYNNSLEKDSSAIAPIVKGHPKTDDPAYGWVEKLKVNGDKLLAKVKDIVPEFAEEVRAGRFRKVSIALFPGNLLRHIGFLGAATPAIKGLEPATFADKGEYIEYSYSAEANESELLIEQLSRENRLLKSKLNKLESEQKNAEYSEFIEELLAENKITPHQAKSLKLILMRVSESKNYSEGESIIENIKEFANSISAMTLLNSEFAQNEIPADDGQFEGKNTSPERLAIHKKATTISRDNPNINYEQALLLALDH